MSTSEWACSLPLTRNDWYGNKNAAAIEPQAFSIRMRDNLLLWLGQLPKITGEAAQAELLTKLAIPRSYELPLPKIAIA